MASLLSTSIDSTPFLPTSPSADPPTDSSRFPDFGSSNSFSASICLSLSYQEQKSKLINWSTDTLKKSTRFFCHDLGKPTRYKARLARKDRKIIKKIAKISRHSKDSNFDKNPVLSSNSGRCEADNNHNKKADYHNKGVFKFVLSCLSK